MKGNGAFAPNFSEVSRTCPDTSENLPRMSQMSSDQNRRDLLFCRG